MAAYRFMGVRKAPTGKSEQCCEPVCGPTTCGTSTAATKKDSKEMAKDECCEPECSPTVCP